MDLLEILKTRFEENRHRHPELDWETVEGRLRDRPDCRMVLQRMEDTGGEPDVIGTDDDGKILFGDCSRETPSGRRSLCYDDEALRKRKKNPPSGSAVQQAHEIPLPETADAGRIRPQDFQLDPDAGGCESVGRRTVLREAVRSRLRVPQRRGFLLFRAGMARRPAGIELTISGRM